MQKKATKETLRRVVRTFLQAALGVIPGGIANLALAGSSKELKTSIAILVGTAVTAGLTAAMNLETVSTATAPEEKKEVETGCSVEQSDVLINTEMFKDMMAVVSAETLDENNIDITKE